ncbi:MAG TPA: ABC transporter substrate-binding protein [Candidatus Baltobacteraceae bacterium]|nr:ABC transporter substrate-binding protein [Candidatus Baltobacteraceae bacterium]
MKFVFFALLAALAGCARAGSVSNGPVPQAHRIVTLMPSFAEDVCALGARDRLVAVSEYSGDVPCARGLPEVNNFSSVNTEKIVSLHADRVFALPEQAGMAQGLKRAGIPVTFLPDDGYNDIFTDLQAIGDATGRSGAAAQLIAHLKTQTARLRETERYRKTPSVLFVEQAAPLWTIGPKSYIATLIGLAGGRIATASLRTSYAQFSDEALLRADPDVIVATADSRIDQVLGREPWRTLRAVRAHRVFVAADSNMLVRPSPRYVKGLQWLIARFSSL